MQQAKPYLEYYNQAKSIYDMVKPNGSLQKGDPTEIASDIVGAGGGLGNMGFDKLSPDMQKALLAVLQKKA
jgi:hypothetical protein